MIKFGNSSLLVLVVILLAGLTYANEKYDLPHGETAKKPSLVKQKSSAELYLKEHSAWSNTSSTFSLNESSTKPELARKGIKKSDERFTPTESISEDLSVSFPVDI